MKRLIGFVLAVSLLLIATVAQAVTIRVEWTYFGTETDLGGFRFFLDGVKVADVPDPLARVANFNVTLKDSQNTFTVKAFDKGGNEGMSSVPFLLDAPPKGVPTIKGVTTIDGATIGGTTVRP